MKVSIPNRCNKNFDSFERTLNGGFCKDCQKEVIDFTLMSKTEIKNYLLNNKGQVCGRFTSKEINLSPTKYRKVKRGLLASSLSLLSVIIPSQLLAQQNNSQKLSQLTEINSKVFNKNKKPVQEVLSRTSELAKLRKIEISGTLVDIEQAPLIGAPVHIVGTKKGQTTDLDGNFKLQIDVVTTDTLHLQFNYVGFKSLNIFLDPNKNKFDLGKIVLEQNEALMLESITWMGTIVTTNNASGIVKALPKKVWNKIKKSIGTIKK